MDAILALEDGTIFRGKAFGVKGERFGEVVFNTSMTGYQEILTDPSYKGQLVTLTYPLIGNYGINYEDVESFKIHLDGLIIKELCRTPSNFRSRCSLDDYLIEYKIVGIEGIDTRALTKHIRLSGAKKGIVSTECLDEKEAVNKAKASPGLVGRDLVTYVTTKKTYEWVDEKISNYDFHIVAIDCGIKYNILRKLNENSCRVTVVPASTSSQDILNLKPDGIFLSNGPGDPEGVPYVVETVRELIGQKPLFGICLGHQILGLALGGKTYKLKFGHHGANHPVKNIQTGEIEITSQNHGFNVEESSLNTDDIEITHMNLNDHTVEGFKHKKYPLFSVQYHPEASPGPHDADYLFGCFIEMIKGGKW